MIQLHLLYKSHDVFPPRDIAFIHPGQSALVKLTAYDYPSTAAWMGK